MATKNIVEKSVSIEREEWLNSIITNTAEGANNASSSSTSTGSPDSPADKSRPLIHKVPQMLRETKECETYYALRDVSIGPYHHHNQKLHQMNKFKLIFAREFVSNDKQRLDGLYEVLLKKIEQVRDCYEENSTNEFSDEAFTQMMLLDGCFILHFIDCFQYEEKMAKMKMITYHFSFVQHELLSLENQLPFLVLKELMEASATTKSSSSSTTWMKKVIRFIETINIMVPRPNIWTWKINVVDDIDEPAHLLELLHKTMVGTGSRSGHERLQSSGFNNEEANSYTVRNVMELKEAGIQVKLSKSSRLTDIHYRSLSVSGRLRLPPITVDDTTKPKLMNLIAYECLR